MSTRNQHPEPAHGGKVANDHNRAGGQAPSQRHESQRTPESRSDRESHVGGHNQSQTQRHPAGPAGH